MSPKNVVLNLDQLNPYAKWISFIPNPDLYCF